MKLKTDFFDPPGRDHRGEDRRNREENLMEDRQYCKHGMVKAYCAICSGLKCYRVATANPKSTGRGIGRIKEDNRPMMVWRKEL